MLTIFAIPKPFRGHFNIIQRNSIQSWCRLRPACQIILFGDEEGTAEAAAEFHTQHIPDVPRNEYGTPLVDFIFEKAEHFAATSLVAYVNADIIMMNDFLTAVSGVRLDKFFLTGQRWDLDVMELLDFDAPDWESRLRSRLAKDGCIHSPVGSDYLVFPKFMFGKIPPFLIGRTAADHWFFFKARSLGIPVINATKMVTCIHQNHERTYDSVGLKGPQGETDLISGAEARVNVELLGGKDNVMTLEYATHFLTPQGLKPALTPRYIYFRLRAMPILHRRFHFLLGFFKAFERAVVALRSIGILKTPAAI